MSPTPATAQTRPIESTHATAHNGLQAWTLSKIIQGVEHPGPLPNTLILARRGHLVHRIAGAPFVWNFVFLSGGRQIAIESGPLHFSMQCILLDTRTARQLEQYDCFPEPLAADAPSWVKTLHSTPQPQTPLMR